jgi:FlaA1/EpsC-like NDP-sugar epimerase
MNVKLQTIKYVLLDAFAAALAWFSLFTYRKLYIEYTPIEFNPNFFYALLLIPIFWISLYVLLGLYADIYRRHRLKELGQIISVSGLGVIVLFFAFILDDHI